MRTDPFFEDESTLILEHGNGAISEVSAVGGVTPEQVLAAGRYLREDKDDLRKGGTSWRLRKWAIAALVTGQYEGAALLVERFLQSSYLYAHRADGLVKLGRSHHPDKRLTEQRVSCPVPMEQMAAVPEWVVSESEAHEEWQELKHHGEWFELTPELATWISDLPNRQRSLRRLKERVDRFVKRRLDPHRPLRHLRAVEAQVEERRREREARERAEKEKAKGCVLCGKKGRLQSNKYLPGYFCQSCRMFTYKIRDNDQEELRQKKVERIERAKQSLEKFDRRCRQLERYISEGE